MLSAALGVTGIIRKKRRVYEKDNLRICLDSIDELGEYISCTVCLKFKIFSELLRLK